MEKPLEILLVWEVFWGLQAAPEWFITWLCWTGGSQKTDFKLSLIDAISATGSQAMWKYKKFKGDSESLVLNFPSPGKSVTKFIL